MSTLLALGTTGKIIIGAVVAVIVFSIVMHFINREFRIRYRLNLFGGGLLMILAIGGVVAFFLGLKGTIPKGLGFAGLVIALILIILTLVYDCKKCGGAGVLALLCQIVFAPCALFLILELFSNSGRSIPYGDYQDRRDIREARRRRGYDDDNNGYY